MSKLKIQSTAYPDGDKLSFDEWRNSIALFSNLNKVTNSLKKLADKLNDLAENTRYKCSYDEALPESSNIGCGSSPSPILYFIDGERVYPSKNSINIELKKPSNIPFSTLNDSTLMSWLKEYTKAENYEMCAKIRDELNHRKIQP